MNEAMKKIEELKKLVRLTDEESKRKVDEIAIWFKDHKDPESQELFDSLETHDSIDKVIELLEQVLNTFATDEFNVDRIHECVSIAVTEGEKMTMVFKEKSSSKNKAVIYLRYLNNGHFYPLLRVFNLNRIGTYLLFPYLLTARSG